VATFVGADKVAVVGVQAGAPAAVLIDLASARRTELRFPPLYASSDAARVAITTDDNVVLAWNVAGGAPRELLKLGEHEVFSGWSDEADRVYLGTWDGPRARVELLDLPSGRRKPVREIVVGSAAGMLHTPDLFLSADASAYVYNFARLLSTLYLVEGLFP
jgi:hypothetical protein